MATRKSTECIRNSRYKPENSNTPGITFPLINGSHLLYVIQKPLLNETREHDIETKYNLNTKKERKKDETKRKLNGNVRGGKMGKKLGRHEHLRTDRDRVRYLQKPRKRA